MAFCINCGTKMVDGAKFCASCGTAAVVVEGAGTPASAPVPAAAAPPDDDELDDDLFAFANEELSDEEKKVRECRSRGSSYMEEGNYDLAIAAYSEAIQLVPNDALNYIDRGDANFNKGNYDLAIADYTQAIQLKPDPYFAKDAYSNRGLAQKRKGNYDLAITDYSEAIKLYPNHGRTYILRGHAYRDKGSYDQAINDYTKVIQLDAKNDDAYNNRGNIYHNNKKDYKRAVADFEAALKINPNHQHAGKNLELSRNMLQSTLGYVLQLPKGVVKITSEMVKLPPNYRGALVIPEGIRVIGESAFEGKAITSVVFPKSLEKIEGNAFARCQLRELSVIGSQEGKQITIEGYAFFGNTSLDKITLGNCNIDAPVFGSCPVFQVTVTGGNTIGYKMLGLRYTADGNDCSTMEDDFIRTVINIYGGAPGTYRLTRKPFKAYFPCCAECHHTKTNTCNEFTLQIRMTDAFDRFNNFVFGNIADAKWEMV